MQGPTAMPAFNSAGFNTSTYAYPDTDHGHDVFYNEYQDIEVREYRIGMFLWHTKCIIAMQLDTSDTILCAAYGKWSTNGTPFEENPLSPQHLIY